MNKVIAGITASTLLGLSLFAGSPAFADHLPPNVSCSQVLVTPAQDAVPAVPAVPAVEATPSQWWNFAPNDNKGPFDGPPSFPNDPRGTWNGPHTNGGPDQETTGTFQNGNGHGSWFHREPAVEAVPGIAEIPAVPAKDAVFNEECITEVPEHPVTPEEPVTPTVPVTPVVPVLPVPTCADLGVTNIASGTANYFAQNDNDKDGVACEQVSTSPKSEVPVAEQEQAVAQTPSQATHGAQLANTGAEELIVPAGIALLILLSGVGLVLLNRRTA